MSVEIFVAAVAFLNHLITAVLSGPFSCLQLPWFHWERLDLEQIWW